MECKYEPEGQIYCQCLNFNVYNLMILTGRNIYHVLVVEYYRFHMLDIVVKGDWGHFHRMRENTHQGQLDWE